MRIKRPENIQPQFHPVSAMWEACSRNDLGAMYDLMLKTGYKDDEGAENEVIPFYIKFLFLFLLVAWQFFVDQVFVDLLLL